MLGCAVPDPNRHTAKPTSTPTPALPASANPATRLEFSEKAIKEDRFADALEQLELIPKDAPEYKKAQTLTAAAQKGLAQQRKNEAPAARERLRGQYQDLLSEANPQLNFIQSKLTKMKGGYALWAVHDYFSRYTFSIGSDAKVVQAWIDENRTELHNAEIVRVGVMGRGGFASYCWFDVR